MRAVGFHRQHNFSNQVGTDPFDTQIPANREIEIYCDRNGHQLCGSYTVPVGSTTSKIYRRMVCDLSTGKPVLLIIPDSTHLSEDIESFVTRLLELSDLGVEVRCTDSDRPDPLQSAQDLLALPGRSAKRLKRTRDAVMAKAARGQVLGRIPYGYNAGLDGQLKELPNESDIVRKIFKWYVEPSYKSDSSKNGGIGMRLIANRLNNQGFLTRKGKPWTPISVAGILKNRAYLGIYNRYGIRIVGSHDRLVGRKIFNRVSELLEIRRPKRRDRQQGEFLLRGLVTSAGSNHSLFGLTRRRRWRNQDGTARLKTYRYYECPILESSNENPKKLVKLSWQAEKLEAMVINQIISWPKDKFPEFKITDENKKLIWGKKISSAERDFIRALRSVSNGYGTIQDLRGPLKDLSVARAEKTGLADDDLDIRDIKKTISNSNVNNSRKAILSVVDKILVGHDSIEIVPLYK